jgi:hypothetical protein
MGMGETGRQALTSHPVKHERPSNAPSELQPEISVCATNRSETHLRSIRLRAHEPTRSMRAFLHLMKLGLPNVFELHPVLLRVS